MINNEYDKINIPENIDINIENGVEKALLEKTKLNKKKKRKVVGTIAASLVAVLTLGISNPALAAKIPIIGHVFEAIEKNLYNPGDYSKYATSINETVHSNGIGVTLSEVLCDGQSLYVTYIVESEEPFNCESGHDLKDMTHMGINGKYNKVDFSEEQLDDTNVHSTEGKFINENTFVGVKKFNLSFLKTEIPDNFEFHTKINRIENYALQSEHPEYCKRGMWEFKIPVTVNKDLKEGIDLTEKDVESEVAKVTSISSTPFETEIDINYKVGNENDYRIFVLAENGEMLNLYSREKHENKIDTKVVVKASNSIRIVITKYFEGKTSDFYTKPDMDIVFDKTIPIK